MSRFQTADQRKFKQKLRIIRNVYNEIMLRNEKLPIEIMRNKNERSELFTDF